MKTVWCILHSSADTTGTFQEFFVRHGYEFKIIIAPDASPADFKAAAAAELLIVMGGSMGVYEKDEFPFLKTELEILKQRIDSDLPTLGICLGAQLLAAATGAKVYRANQEEFGWFPIKATQQGALDILVGKTNKLWDKPVFQWHQDIFDLPASAENLFYSERCAHQAFKLTDKIYAFQFHLELDSHELPDWIKGEPDLHYGSNPGVQSKDQMISHGLKYGDEYKTTAHEILFNYIKLIQE